MEIGPITAVRAVPLVKPLRPNGDLSAVFAVEFRKQADEQTYSSNRQKASRGLEEQDIQDEQSEGDDLVGKGEIAGSGSALAPALGSNIVSFFA